MCGVTSKWSWYRSEWVISPSTGLYDISVTSVGILSTMMSLHWGAHGIGILMSGGGSDGTVGLKAIKEGGGLIMAQLPAEAAYDAMPASAIATGLVDFVLPIEDG